MVQKLADQLGSASLDQLALGRSEPGELSRVPVQHAATNFVSPVAQSNNGRNDSPGARQDS